MAVISVLMIAVAPSPSRSTTPDDQVASNQGAEAARVAVPEADERTIRYYRTGMVAWGLRGILTIAVPMAILALGVLPRMQRSFTRWHWSVQAVFLTATYAIIALAAMLPVAFYDEYVRARGVGLTERSAPEWALEWMIRAALTVGFAALMGPLAYLLIRKRPTSWWLWGGLSGGAVGFVLGLVFPVWVAPLLDRFRPMENSALRQDILAVAERAGVEAPSLFVVAKRGETETVNAYVAGFGDTKRIVFWDTIIDALTPAELRFVAAHELAHAVLNHRWLMLAVGTAILTICLWGARRLAIFMAARLAGRSRNLLGDPAYLPLLILAATIVGFILLPIALATNRYIEREADRFALELTHDNQAAATTWLQLQGRNLTHPDPGIVYRLFRATHPPLAGRIRFANEYRPWESE